MSVVVAGRRTAVRLAHPLYGEVLRARMPPLRLRRIQHELADIVEGHGSRRREDVVQVALWRVESGGRVAGDQLLRAARLALAGHDPHLAMRLIDAWPEDDDTGAFARAEVLAEAYDLLGQHDDVERVVTAALAAGAHRCRAQRAQSPPGADPLLVAARPRRCARRAGRGIATSCATPTSSARIQGRRALLLADAGRPAEALEVLDTIVVHRDARGQRRAGHGTGGEPAQRRPPRRGRRACRGRAAELQTTLPGWQARRGMSGHLVNEAHALAYSGRYAEARQLVEPAAEQARAANAIGRRGCGSR